LIAYFFINISAKKLSKSVHVLKKNYSLPKTFFYVFKAGLQAYTTLH